MPVVLVFVRGTVISSFSCSISMYSRCLIRSGLWLGGGVLGDDMAGVVAGTGRDRR